MVPLVGGAPGQHFLAMAPMGPAMAPMAPIVPPIPMGMPGVGVAVPFQCDNVAPIEPEAAETASVEEMPAEEVPVAPEDVEKLQKPRKKPTRRGGKRARHRPCHAAAMEWASSVGSAETPSFGEPGSGEEAEGEDETEESSSIEKKDTAKPRSFYPLAARLRLAAGLKMEKSKARVSADLIKPELELAQLAPIEVIEEVEPEPASASDVSDIPKKVKEELKEIKEELTVGLGDALLDRRHGTGFGMLCRQALVA